MKKTATAKSQPRISLKHSIEIAKEIRRKPVNKAINFLNNLIDKKVKLPNGRYHTKAAEEILNLIESAKANAEFKGLNIEKLFIKEFKTNKSFRFIKPKTRFRFRGRQAKICNLEITLEER